MLLDDIARIRGTWTYLRESVSRYSSLSQQERENVKRRLLEMKKYVESLISNYKDALVAATILDEAQRLLQSIHSLISLLRGGDYYGSVSPEELKLRLSRVDNSLNELFRLVMERRTVLENVSYSRSKREEVKATTPKVEVKEEVTKEEPEIKAKESEKPKEEKKEEKESKEEEKKEKKSKENKIIRKIFLALSFPFILLSLYYLFISNSIYFLIFSSVAIVFYFLGSRKIPFGAIIMVVLLFIIIHTFTATAFSRYICLSTGYCPGESKEENNEKYLAAVKENILKAFRDMQMIMSNPEAYFIEKQAESEALDESYKYLLDISSPYSVYPVYYMVGKSEKEVDISKSPPLLYSVRSSLPENVQEIRVDSYCMVSPGISLSCIKSIDYEYNFSYNGKVYYVIKQTNEKLPIYGILNYFCYIPSFTINLTSCEDLRSSRFYMKNLFILRLNGVKTTTYYKFLVVDSNLIAQAIKNNKDIYAYLNMNEYEYDRGYFKGFIDFPKINVLRLGVISKYPLIIFEENKNAGRMVNDVIYISLSNIEEIYNILGIRIRITYNPNETSIKTNLPKETNNSLYSLNCTDGNGEITCNIWFNYADDGFLGRNLYLNLYKENSESLFFFIPIEVGIGRAFREYSEVLITAEAEYDIEKIISNSIEYVPLAIPS